MATFTITIEVTGGEPVVVIRDSSGNEKRVTGFAMFGFSPEADEFYAFSWGCPDHVAKAVTEVMGRSFAAGDPWYVEFYRGLLAEMVRRTGVIPPGGQIVSAEELLARWEKEDAAAAIAAGGSKDPTKWN